MRGKAAEKPWKISHAPSGTGLQQQRQRYVPLLGLGREEWRREAAQLGPAKDMYQVREENHRRKNRQLSETDPKASDSHNPGEKKHPCRAVTWQPVKRSLPVSPARNANSLDDVDRYLAEEDEKEDEEAEGAVRPVGETAAGVKPGDMIPVQTPSSKRRETNSANPFLQGTASKGR